MEQWRPIPGWEKRYEVSDLGQVRSLVAARGPRRAPRSLRPTVHQSGHCYVTLTDGERKHHAQIHRLVLGAFVGPCPPGMETRHDDGNASNNVLANLCWGTRAENARDRVRLGESSRGSHRHSAKLTEAAVRAIRCEVGRVSIRALARRYGVSHRAVQQVLSGRTWAWVV